MTGKGILVLRASGEANPDPEAVEEAVVGVMDFNQTKVLVKEDKNGDKWTMGVLMGEPRARALGMAGPRMIP